MKTKPNKNEVSMEWETKEKWHKMLEVWVKFNPDMRNFDGVKKCYWTNMYVPDALPLRYV